MANWRLKDPATLVSRWSLGGHAMDDMGRYPGTLVNAPTWGTFFKNSKQCIELNGNNQYSNVGDIIQLNAVETFTICFWMNQDVLDVADILFYKQTDVNNRIRIDTDAAGDMIFYIGNAANSYGDFDYSTVISAATWHHVAMAYDGSQTGDANRLVVYVDGIPVTLAFTNNIPATTANLAGQDASIGYSATSFDGEFYDWRLYNCPLTRDEVNQIIHEPTPL